MSDGMERRRLGGTGLEVSAVGLGTWQLGGEWGRVSQRDADEILDAAREVGISLVDTGECYGDHRAEELIGAAVAHDRERWVLATKFGHRYLGPDSRRDEWSAGEVVAQLDRSLRALRTDRVDLYQFHSGSLDVLDDDDLWAALHRAVDSGKVRHLGISTNQRCSDEHLVRARELGASVVQLVYNAVDRRSERFALPYAAEHDLGVIGREALASGLLSGRYRPGARFSGDPRGSRSPDSLDRVLATVEELRSTLPPGVDLPAWAAAWCLRRPEIGSVVIGCRNAAQVRGLAAVVAHASP
jgi:aryl-alcohol dehydrogenase-like predicted oxidoreductase